MMLNTRTFKIAAAATAVFWSASAQAASDPTGLWFDHNGRGAVEIAPCATGKGLCGYVVHIKDEKNAKRCGMQILGNVTPEGGGWIYSPDRGRKYSVELARTGDNTLRVVGNAGSMFSKTFTWNRAPDDLTRCGETTAAAPAKVVEAKAAPAVVSDAAPARAAASEPVREPATTRSLGGSNSASLALMGAPKSRQADDVTPVAATTEIEKPAPAPVATKEAAPAKETPANTAPASVAASEEENVETELKRDCKFKIPYVGRVISVPCRD
jgi:uncharacterized protein (DUF2147 family)